MIMTEFRNLTQKAFKTMRKIIPVLAVFILILLINCNKKSTKKETQVNMSKGTIVNNKKNSKGFQLLESNCFSCHSPDVNTKHKIAPTMADIRKHYITEGMTNKNFNINLINFVKNPIDENTIIPQAIQRYGLMPKFDLSEEDLTQIANYIYHIKFENSDWYANHYKKEKKNNKIIKKNLSYVALGKHYVMSTKSILGKNLKGAIKNKGTENAVEFCNARAYPLTDSMAYALNTKIKRVSDKPRNHLNTANKTELNYISSSKVSLKKGIKIKPKTQKINGKIIGYYPIMTSKMCLQCHGKPNTQIKPLTLNKLNYLYPKDMAKGYTENQLRGIWVVEMDKNKIVIKEK